MPYVKPETLIKAQFLADEVGDDLESDDSKQRQAIIDVLDICPVCDDYDCEKTVVKANGVYVHPEDVGDADEIARGEFPS